jgi:co-chaperonin GroES (HSP10)
MPEIPDEIKKEVLDLQPLGSNVYIYVLSRDKKMGRIEMPGQYRLHTETAIVIAVGEKVEELKVGDKVLITFNQGSHLQITETYNESSQHRIIIEHNVLTKVGE